MSDLYIFDGPGEYIWAPYVPLYSTATFDYKKFKSLIIDRDLESGQSLEEEFFSREANR